MASNISVLLADDDRLGLVTLANGLREAGFNVHTAENGTDALQLGLEHALDMAVLDMKMPGLDGLEVARRLFLEKQIPFMFLTAYSEEELVQQATREGALGYIVKPIETDQLIPIIRTSLERARDLEKLKQSQAHLHTALNANREISEAIGILVGRGHVENKDDAFEMLRRYSRKNEIKVKDAARLLVEQVSQTNHLLQQITDS